MLAVRIVFHDRIATDNVTIIRAAATNRDGWNLFMRGEAVLGLKRGQGESRSRLSRRVVWARLLASTSVLPFIFIHPIAVQFGPAGVITLACTLWFVNIQIGNLARRMEVRADALAVADTGAGTYASALEHIYRINLVPAVMPGKRHQHPHLYDWLPPLELRRSLSDPNHPARSA
jgi:hypothetical protein